MFAGGEADDEVHPRQRGVGEEGIVGRDPAAIGLGQQVSRTGAQLGIVALARHVHQHRGETVIGVAAFEQAHARPVVEVQDVERGDQQVVGRHLEEFVARMVLDDILQALLVVAARQDVGLGQHAIELGADQRHLAGRPVIGLGGEQADETHLAGGLAVGAVALDPHIVHVAAPVDQAAHVGLGDHHGRVGQALADLGRQHRRLGGAAQHGALGIAQHAQAVLRLVERLLGRIVAIGQARVLVDPGAQIDEVLVVQPVEEGHVLFPRGHLRLARQGPCAQFGGGLAHQGQHGGEVVDRGPHVRQGRLHPLDQGRLAVGADPVQHYLDHGFAHRRAAPAASAGLVA